MRFGGVQKWRMCEEVGEGDVQSRSCWWRFLDLHFPITIEPLVLLYTLSVGLNEVIRSNLIIDKICQVGNASI